MLRRADAWSPSRASMGSRTWRSSSRRMRIFLAINPPEEVRRRVWEATASLREASPGVAWVPEPKIHLTLKFLGETPDAGIPDLIESMTAMARTHAAPMVHL